MGSRASTWLDWCYPTAGYALKTLWIPAPLIALLLPYSTHITKNLQAREIQRYSYPVLFSWAWAYPDFRKSGRPVTLNNWSCKEENESVVTQFCMCKLLALNPFPSRNCQVPYVSSMGMFSPLWLVLLTINSLSLEISKEWELWKMITEINRKILALLICKSLGSFTTYSKVILINLNICSPLPLRKNCHSWLRAGGVTINNIAMSQMILDVPQLYRISKIIIIKKKLSIILNCENG